MLKTYKPTIAMLLLTLGGIGGIHMDEQLAAQGADLVVGAAGAFGTLLAFALKLWATRQTANQATNQAASGASNNDGGGFTGLVLVLLLLSPLLTACASLQAETPQQTVYALMKEHQAAQQLVLAYVEAPGAKPSLVIALNDLDRTVYDSLHAAQLAVRAGNDPKLPALIAAARSALEILTKRLAIEGLMPQPPPKSAALDFPAVTQATTI